MHATEKEMQKTFPSRCKLCSTYCFRASHSSVRSRKRCTQRVVQEGECVFIMQKWEKIQRKCTFHGRGAVAISPPPLFGVNFAPEKNCARGNCGDEKRTLHLPFMCSFSAMKRIYTTVCTDIHVSSASQKMSAVTNCVKAN